MDGRSPVTKKLIGWLFFCPLALAVAGCGWWPQTEPPPQQEADEVSQPSPDWDCSRDEDGLWNCKGASQPVSEGPAASLEAPRANTPDAAGAALPAPARAAGADGAVAMTPDDFLLQVGAFRERERALAEARRIDRSDMLVMPTVQDGEDVFVLVAGVYATETDARLAGEAFLAEHPAGSVWVRPARDFKTALVPRDS
jgi:septal ring-binding cell division protein DamX